MMKKAACLCAVFLLMFLLVGCSGPIEDTHSIIAGETYAIDPEELADYPALSWYTLDETIATADDAIIAAHGPGTTSIVALHEQEVIAEYEVIVLPVPVDELVLSDETAKLWEQDTFALSYTITPAAASAQGLLWLSSNEDVASIDSSGLITDLSPGEASISVSDSDGELATCDVIVYSRAAYEQMSDDERAFVDVLFPYMDTFYQPYPLTIDGISLYSPGLWQVLISVENPFAGTTTQIFSLSESRLLSRADIPIAEFSPDDGYDISLINQVIDLLHD